MLDTRKLFKRRRGPACCHRQFTVACFGAFVVANAKHRDAWEANAQACQEFLAMPVPNAYANICQPFRSGSLGK